MNEEEAITQFHALRGAWLTDGWYAYCGDEIQSDHSRKWWMLHALV
jgi:hypothetical protein